MKKLIVIFVMFVIYVIYSCSSASSQEIKASASYLNTTIDTVIPVMPEVIIQDKLKKSKQDVEVNRKYNDSSLMVKQEKQKEIMTSLEYGTKALDEQNYKMDSLINIIQKKKKNNDN